MFYLTKKSNLNKPAAMLGSWALPIFLMFSMMLASGCSGLIAKPKSPVTVDEIIQMSKDEVPETTILEKMRSSGTTYKLSASELADLRDQGVVDAVINTMQETHLESVRRNQRLDDQSFRARYNCGRLYRRYPLVW